MRLLFLSILWICVLAAPVKAQLQWVFIADGEVAIPISGPDGFTERYSSIGYGGGAGLGAVLSNQLMFVFKINYTLLPIDDAGFREADNLPDDAEISGGDVDLWYVSAGARYNVTQNPVLHAKPYAVGGLGWYRIESADVTVSSPTIGEKSGSGASENVFGFNVGAGADILISPKVSAFVEIQYVAGLTNGGMTTTLPIRGGLVFLLGQGD